MKLNKYITLIACLLFLGGVSQAQQRPQFTQYMVNNYLINPAVTGAYDYVDVRTGFRNQWTGFDSGSPRTFFISAHSALNPTFRNRPKGPLPTIGTQRDTKRLEKEKTVSGHGVGGMLLYDETGPLSRIMVYGSYAFNFQLTSKLRASLGLQGGFIRYQQNNSELVPDPLNPGSVDPALEGNQSSSLIPDVGAGLLVYSDRFYAGFSSSQLMQNDLSYSNVNVGGATNRLVRHYFLTGGYKLPIGSQGKIDFIPSLLVKFLEGSPASVDINGRFAFNLSEKSHLWTGVSYRYDDALAALMGVAISDLIDINFSYDFPLTSIRTTANNPSLNVGTFEVSLGLRLSGYQRNYSHNLF